MRTQLQTFGGDDPIWRFVGQMAAERFTGSAHVGHDPRLRLFAVDGRIYFAERDGDAPVGTRLVNFGVMTATQLARGQVQVGDVVSLARLFHRDPSIDRDAVELTIEMATERLLESMANRPVVDVELYPLRHHPAGLHLWERAIPVAVYEPPAAIDPEAAPVPAPAPILGAVVPEPADLVEPPVAAPAPQDHAPAVTPDEPAVALPVMSTFEPALRTPEPVIEPVIEPVSEPVSTAAPEPPSLQSFSVPSLSPQAHEQMAPTEPAADHTSTVDLTGPDEVPVLTGLQALQALQALAPEPSFEEPAAAAVAGDPTPALSTPAAVEHPATTPAGTHLLDELLSGGRREPEAQPPSFEPAQYSPSFDESAPAALPTLAASPTSVADIKAHQAYQADSGSGWGATHNLAAVEIWEMVDDMLAEPKPADTLVAAGGQDRKGRGWLRGRKG